MARSKFLLVDLSEPKTKKLAETITSESSRRILEHLADREDDTESGIAAALGIPLSTVHYHVQKLQEAKLIATEEFHYSPKGREVQHYKLANKYIIIAPRKVEGLREKLRAVLPVALAVAGIGVVWKLVQWLSAWISSPVAASSIVTGIEKAKAAYVPEEAIPSAAEVAQETVTEAGRVAADAAQEAVSAAAQQAAVEAPPEVLSATAQQPVIQQPDVLLWFLLGAAVAIAVFVVVIVVRERLQKR